MRCVLMTALGEPVDPEVNRNLAMVSGPTRSCAASAAPVGSVASSASKATAFRPVTGLRTVTAGTSGAATAAIAGANGLPSAAKTRPGVSSAKMPRSLA